ncbi:thyrotropin-releasing hormone receptor-like [Acanthaster planci]|uniref:Thyrotropin-releasing hormone receptor-like n=1 Tax=Acanthaster planci TaxID=133434 RepID=A0A8B7ZAI7_ACAPL|nr:thyrotropin-releasing hormone receptor-like [Acanthaster planci]
MPVTFETTRTAVENKVATMTCPAHNTFNCSLSTEFAASFLYDITSLVLVLAVMPTILTIGLVGNLAFLFVMARIRSMRTVTNAYLMNLAIADILFLVVTVGDKLARYLVTPVPWDQLYLGVAGCTSLNLLQHLFNWVSIFLVTLVTLERYYGVCHPLKHMVMYTYSRTWKLIAGAWFLALFCSVVVVPTHCRVLLKCIVWPDSTEYSAYPNIVGVCAPVPSNDWLAISTNLFQTIPFFSAMVFNCFAYVRIIRALKDRPGSNALSQHAISMNDRVRNQVSIMLIANGVSFFVCGAPFQALSFGAAIQDIVDDERGFGSFVHVARTMLYLNSAINPFIYNATNPSYRRSFRDAFMRRVSSRESAQRQYLSKARKSPPQTLNVNSIELCPSKTDKDASGQITE